MDELFEFTVGLLLTLGGLAFMIWLATGFDTPQDVVVVEIESREKVTIDTIYTIKYRNVENGYIYYRQKTNSKNASVGDSLSIWE